MEGAATRGETALKAFGNVAVHSAPNEAKDPGQYEDGASIP
jgi:hypothetical protein